MNSSKTRFDAGTPSHLPRVVCGLFLSALFVSAVTPETSRAALQEYEVHFAPSPDGRAAGYLLHVGLDAGSYDTEFDLGAPPATGGRIVYAVDLEDSVDLYVALSAYDDRGVESGFCSQKTLRLCARLFVTLRLGWSGPGSDLGGRLRTSCTVDFRSTPDSTLGFVIAGLV